MKIVWISLMLAGILSMMYHTIVYGNLNVNWVIIFVGIITTWYGIYSEKQTFKKRKISLFNN